MAKKAIKKPVPRKRTTKVYDCDYVEKYIDKALNIVKKEIIPKIDIIDRRDRDQYDAAKKIMIDVTTVIGKRQDHTEKIAESVQKELDNIVENQDNIVSNINGLLTGLHDKVDKHIIDESTTFVEIQASLTDIMENGTKLAREISVKLDKIEVNGGVYPLNEALKYIYKQHLDTHEKLESNSLKLDEVYNLVEPMRIKKTWMSSTKELIAKNGFFHFVLGTKTGAFIGLTILLLLVNTILVDVFKVDFDIKSIFKWVAGFLPKQ